MRALARALASGATLALVCLPALAGNWRVAPEQSEIRFEYQRDGAPAEGIFARFDGTGTFSAEAPADARLTLRIEARSIDLYDRLASGFANSAEWFDSKHHPHVTYQLDRLVPMDGTLYRAEGRLTIRGETQPISSEIRLAIGDTQATAEGGLEIRRADYWLGVGPGAIFVDIGPMVTVRFNLVALPAD